MRMEGVIHGVINGFDVTTNRAAQRENDWILRALDGNWQQQHPQVLEILRFNLYHFF